MLWDFILQYSFATLARQKAGSLFRVPLSLWNPAEMFPVLQATQLQYVPAKMSKQSVLLYLYDPDQLVNILSFPANSHFLTQLEYPKHTDAALRLLLEKIRTGTTFPHEVGLFLGYPLRDVQGYMENHGQNSLYTGYWKVYHNIKKAKNQFERLDMYKQYCAKAHQEGASPEEIVRMLISI